MAHLKRIALLGSTGSIGRQTLDVIEAFPDRFRAAALGCQRSVEALVAQARRHRPKVVAVGDREAAEEAARALEGTGVEVLSGPEGMVRCALEPEVELVVGAATGIAGLLPVWEAVGAGKTVALANKEPLVVAGHLLMAEAEPSATLTAPRYSITAPSAKTPPFWAAVCSVIPLV